MNKLKTDEAVRVKHIQVMSKKALRTPRTAKHPLNNLKPHRTELTPVLMRASVHKPAPSLKRQLTVYGATDNISAPTDLKLRSGVTLPDRNSARHKRARAIKKSERVNHFVAPKVYQVPKPEANLTVSEPRPAQQPPEPPKSRTDVLIEHALEKMATDERSQPEAARPKRRRFGLLVPAALVIALLVGGAIRYTQLDLKVVSNKVGFDAALPSYHPAGYSLGALSYTSGSFASEFQDKTGARNYTITQSTTPWNAADLLNKYVLMNTSNYQTVKLGKQTVYIYGKGNATWINGKIWYQISSGGSLNESQLINTANSL